MEHTDDANIFRQASPEEIEAADCLREDIDEDDIDFRKLFNAQLAEAVGWQNTDNKYCAGLYTKLEKTIPYTLCVWEIQSVSNLSRVNVMNIKYLRLRNTILLFDS
jgi:hypothetical protein